MRGDARILSLSEEFVRLRITLLRGVNIGLFVYDYDQTWMSFFLDADLRIYSRYGSRNAKASDSHNSAEGLLHTMRQVLALHKEENAQPKPPPQLPPKTTPADLPGLTALNYGGSCVRCHMVHEAQYAQQRKAGVLQQESLWLYPLPDNLGMQLDMKLGNVIKEVMPGSFADKAGLQAGDHIRSANGTRVLTIADLQFVLNSLEGSSKLAVEVERDGNPLSAGLDLDGDWKRWDVSWRKSIRLMTWRNAPFTRLLTTLQPKEREKHGIAAGELGLRLVADSPDAQKLGLRKDDVIVAFDGKRKLPYVNPALTMYLEHKSGESMDITFLRDGTERTVTLLVP